MVYAATPIRATSTSLNPTTLQGWWKQITYYFSKSMLNNQEMWFLIGARKTQDFWRQSVARTTATVWNWSGKTFSPGVLLAVGYFSSFHIYFSARLDFPSPPLSAPGSPRMKIRALLSRTFDLLFFHHHSHCIFLLSISHNDIPVLAVPEPGLVAD